MRYQRYRSDLTDTQWESIAPRFADRRKSKHPPRRVLDALLYLAKTGCQWRYLPAQYPPWQTVYYHFRRWTHSGMLTELMHSLRWNVRAQAGRDASPSVALIDSQSVKTSFRGGVRSYDGGKKITGRKRHILTDTMGLLLAVLVHPAGHNDSQRVPADRLRLVYADEGYAGTPPSLMERCFGCEFRLVRRVKPGFVVLPRRWVVERTFAWFGGCRRLSKDYEHLVETSESFVRLAAIGLMVRRLA